MTLEERQSAANAELIKISEWLKAERIRIYNELNEKLGSERKFDNGNSAYNEMIEEFYRRCLAVRDKYDLPPDTKLKLW